MNKKRSPHLGVRTVKLEDVPTVQKTRTQSVLFSLPILMLLIGLGYHFKNQNAEKNGAPIVGESLTLEGSFQGVSSFGKNEKTLHYLEIQLASANKNIHVEDHDLEKLQSFSFGDAITINAAPKVSGSNSLWLLSIQPQ